MTDSRGWSPEPDDGAGGLPRYPGGGGQGSSGQPGVIPLRPLRVGEIVDGALGTMRRYAGVVFGASAAVALVSALLMLAADRWLLAGVDPVTIDQAASPERQLQQFEGALGGLLAANGVVLLITLLTQAFLTGLLMVIVGKAVLGQPITFAEAWEELKPRLLPLLGLTVVVALIVMVGTVLLIIPGVIAFVFLSLATPALVLERGRVGEALRRSATLVTGAWWRVFGVLVLAMVLAFAVSLVIQIPFTFAGGAGLGQGASFDQLLIGELGAAVAQAITVPFSAGMTALIYIDQRMRREGLDTELSRAARM